MTKELAREIYNLYSQIEKTNESIVKMENCIEMCKNGELRDDIIPDKYTFGGSVRLQVPQWMTDGRVDKNTSFSSCTIYDISMVDAVAVLKNHVVRLQKELDEKIAEAKGE